MAKETVEAVRQTELNATQLEKEANQKKEAILLKAQQDSETMISSITKEALTKAEQDLNQAQQRGAQAMEAASLRAEKEILLMKEMIKRKEQAAIDFVLSEVL